MKRPLFIIVALIIAAGLLTACDLTDTPFDFKTSDKILEDMGGSYSVVSELYGTNQGIVVLQSTVYERGTSDKYLLEVRNSEGSTTRKYFKTGGVLYRLNDADMVRIELASSTDPGTLADGLSFLNLGMAFNLASILINFSNFGDEKINGRDATKYEFSSDDALIDYWIDKEYGFCLKVDTYGGGTLQRRWVVTEFTTEGVNFDDIDVAAYHEAIDEIKVNNIPYFITPSTFELNDIVVTVTSGGSSYNIPLTESMLYGMTAAELDSPGNKNVEIHYLGMQCAFNFTVLPDDQSVTFGHYLLGKVDNVWIVYIYYSDSTRDLANLKPEWMNSTDYALLNVPGLHTVGVTVNDIYDTVIVDVPAE